MLNPDSTERGAGLSGRSGRLIREGPEHANMSAQGSGPQPAGSRASRLRTAILLASMPGIVILLVGVAGILNSSWWLQNIGVPGEESISPVIVAGLGAIIVVVVATAVTGMAYLRLDGPIGLLPGQDGIDEHIQSDSDSNPASNANAASSQGARKPGQGGLESLDSVADLLRGPRYRETQDSGKDGTSTASNAQTPASQSTGPATRAASKPPANSQRTDPVIESPSPESPQQTVARPSEERPPVAVLACGGPLSTGEADPEKVLSQSTPSVAEHVDPLVREISTSPGFDIDWTDVLTAADVTRRAVDDVDGIVLSCGVDGLADFAYAMDLLTDLPVPVVLTGAQRGLTAPDSDVEANLTTAARAAGEETFAPGVHVAFHGEVHAASDVVMQNTSALGAFESPGAGPVAVMSSQGARLRRAPGRDVTLDPLTLSAADTDSIPEIPVVHSGIGVGANPVRRALVGDVGGLVVDGTGFGNATGPLGEALTTAADEVPLVVSSRCQIGRTTPAYPQRGGSGWLTEAGVLLAGDLPASKARIALALAQAAELDRSELEALFD